MKRALAGLLCVCAGCVWTTERPTLPHTTAPTPSSTPTVEPTEEPSVAVARPKGFLEDIEVPDASAPMIHIHDVVGVSPAEAGVMFAGATDAMEVCEGREGGVLHVSLTSEDGGAHFKVDPSSTVDANTSGCVLRALSIADPTAGAEQGTNSSELPRRIESVLTISWR